MAGRVYLSSLPCNKEREVGEEKGLGGRFSHLPPPSLLRTRRGFHNVFDSSLKLEKINPLRKKVHSLNSRYIFRKF